MTGLELSNQTAGRIAAILRLLKGAARDGLLWRIYQRNALLWSLVLTVFLFIAWAVVFELDVASYAQGQVVPAGQLKRIQHLEGGIIREIKVVEGQKVQAGEVIAELEGVASDADLGDLRARAAGFELKVLRIESVLAHNGKLAIPPELKTAFPDFSRDAISAFNSYRERYAAMMNSHESRIAQRRAEIAENRARRIALQARSQFIAQQVRISEAMIAQKLSNDYEHLQLQKEQAQIDGDLQSTVASEQRSQTALTEAIAAKAAFQSDEEVTLRKELQEAGAERVSLRERLRKPSDSNERTTVRSPVAGNVMTLYFKNQGAVVPPGGTLATLVPQGETLLIEARLPIGEVGYVSIGSPARLSISAGGGGYSTVAAKVVHISPDAIADEKTGASYYLVRLLPETFAFRRGKDSYALRPGVQVSAAILSGSRSVIALLLDPFFGSGINPLTER